MSRYLGIDLGTSATKALVLDDDGRVLGKGRAGYPVTHPRVGWSEQDPRAWWTAVCSASRQALERAGPGALGAVALSGQLNGLVLLDEHHQPVADALIWLDQRATEEADILNARYPELLRAATLNPANPIYVGAKLLWVRRHRPELLERGRHLLLAKDYINLRLTGELATDTSDASCTLLYDLRTDAWIPELLEASRFDAGRLPPLFRSTDVIGRVRRDAAEVTGIPAGTPVMAGAGDVTALSVGSGAVDEHVVSVTLGTAGHVVAASTALTPDGYQRIWQMRHAVQDRYLRLGLVMSGGLSLAWLERELGEPERLRAGSVGRDSYEVLIERAADSRPGAHGVLFLPFLEGAATPFQEPDLRAAFLDVASSHTKGDLVQAVLEGVAYNVRDCVALFEELGGDTREIRLSEGGSRSDAWCQIIADVLQKPVITLHEIDASALGAAMIAMAGDPAAPRDLRAVVDEVVKTQTDRAFDPRHELADVYDGAYRRYRGAAEHLLAWVREADAT
jgi:xylulokinase